jgi:hypothetical protein
LLARHELSATDLVRASREQLTHKMVARAVKGRRLSGHVMEKVLRALNAAAQAEYRVEELFTYGVQTPPGRPGGPADGVREPGAEAAVRRLDRGAGRAADGRGRESVERA